LDALTVTEDAGTVVPPIITEVSPATKLVPVIVTEVLPAVVPEVGVKELAVGAAS
jgi:hypothetical protein